MQIDDLKQLWTAHGEILERNFAINERLLRETILRKVNSALVPFHVWRTLEVVIGIAIIVASMSVLADHVADPLYVFVAGGLVVFTGYVTWLCAYGLVKSCGVDDTTSVIKLQRDIEQIRLADYRAIKWALLLGIVAWLPVALILFEALTSFDALARVDMAWLGTNVLFGLFCLYVGHAFSRRYLERRDLSPWARTLLEALTDRAVRSATEHLKELANFEKSETTDVTQMRGDTERGET